jgi:putative acetyltransferase
MIIRLLTPADFDAVDIVHRAAFASTALGHRGEADLVRHIHADGDALVSLVAEIDGQIVGHALFSRMEVEADGVPLRGAGLAPVGVLPDLHSGGVGSALIWRGLEMLHEQGIQISFVLGHPDYYPRFGYSKEAARPFASPFTGPHFMALLLDKSVRLPESGRARYAPAFGPER